MKPLDGPHGVGAGRSPTWSVLLLIGLLGTSGSALAHDHLLATPYEAVGHWTAADGLPAETIADVVVDEDRQLWLATYDGAVRYQGFDFRIINRSTAPALPNNRLMSMKAMPGGGVIVQFEDGQLGHLSERAFEPVGQAHRDHFAVFDGAVWFIDKLSSRLQSWRTDGGFADHGVTALTALAVDRYAHRLMLGTDDGRVLVIPGGGQHPRLLANTTEAPLLGMAAGPAGQLLTMNSEGAWQVERSGAISRLSPWKRAQERPLRAIWTERGWLIANLWTAQGAGPNLLGPEGPQALDVIDITSIDSDRSPVAIEQVDHLGRRWVNDGLNLYRDGQLMFSSSQRITSFAIDPFDQIWISQPRHGLRLLKPTMFETYGLQPGELPDPNITLVTELDGRILAGSWVALSALDPETGVWQQLTDRAARDVLPDGDALLVGSIGLCRLEAPFRCDDVDDFPGGDSEVQLLHRETSGAVWAGGEAGLFRRSPGGQWHPEPLHLATVRTALELPDDRIVFGTNGDGLLWRHAGADLSTPFHEIGLEQGLSSGFIRSLLAVEDGLLVGTEDAGLCLLDESLAIVACMDNSDGLPHHSVHYMVVDAQERMWVNTNDGIYQVGLSALLAYLRTETDQPPGFARFGVRDGMPSVEGNGGVYRAGTKTDDGQIWFPNQFGLVAIRTYHDVMPREVALTPSITVLSPERNQNHLHLSSDARLLNIELAAIALAEPQNVQFRYRLGSDASWSMLAEQRRIAFGDLPPGTHQLEVQARYLDTGWIGPTSRLNFTAGYRLFEHPVVHGLLVAALVAALVNIWLAMRRRQAKLQRRVEERSSQLDRATEQLEQLHGSMKKVGLRHRAALQAISHEFKGVLDSALNPLLTQTTEALPEDRLQEVRLKSESLNRLVGLVSDFSQSDADREPEEKTADTADADAKASTDPIPAGIQAPEGHSLNDRIRLEILLHLGDPDFSVETLAERLGLSRSVLYRRVAEFSGSSPAELMRDLRLEQACRMLVDSDEQVSAIADATGFRSVSSFSRAFAKSIGTSPRQWRSQHQRTGSSSDESSAVKA